MSRVAEIFCEALALPLDQRADLAKRIIDSLDDDPPLGPSNEELRSRSKLIKSGQFEASEWPEALARMRAALKKVNVQT